MYIFISIIFIAELIIALSIINFIIKADRKVCDLNDCVTEFNPLAKTCMQYFRCVSDSFCKSVQTGIDFIKKHNERAWVKVISSVAIYSMLVLFRIKRIKAKKLFNLVGAIGDIALDLAV